MEGEEIDENVRQDKIRKGVGVKGDTIQPITENMFVTTAKTLTIIIGKILTATHEPHTKLLRPTPDLRWVSTPGLM